MPAYLLDDMETVVVVLPQNICSHESKDGHDIEGHDVWIYGSNSRHQKQTCVVCLRVISDPNALDDQVDTQRSFLDMPTVLLLRHVSE